MTVLSSRPRVTRSSCRIVVAWLCLATYPALLGAQSRPDYRTYRMGDDAASIARRLGLPSPAAAAPGVPGPVVELRWRAQYVDRGDTPSGDPVARLIFSFYEDRLFRIVIDYASDRTEGMTEADMVAAVSEVYGAPAIRTDPPSRVGLHPRRPTDSVVAQWADGELQVILLAVEGRTAFRLIVASAPLERLARAAGASDASADLQDWASTDTDRERTGLERSQSALEETRRANIAAFIP